MGETSRLETVRKQLAEARISLRIAQDAFHTARLTAEVEFLDRFEGDSKRIGTNEKDRARAFEAIVDGDPACQTAHIAVRTYESQEDKLQAELDCLLDTRRAHEWAIRERLAEALCQPHVDLIGLAHD